MNQITILTQKRHAHVYRNNLRDSLRQSLPVLSKSFLSAPKHTYSSVQAKGYRPLGSATEEFPLPRLVKQTRFIDVAHKDEREPDLVLRVSVYPTISHFRSLEGVSIELQGSSKRFCAQIIGAVDPRPELMLYIRHRLQNSPLSVTYALLNQQRRWINEWQQSYFDSACQKYTKSVERSSDRVDKVMVEGEQREQSEVEEDEEDDELGETGDDEMEEDEEVLTKGDNKKNRGGKKSQRARLEKKLRKAKEDKGDAKLEERNRRPFRPSPSQPDAATLVPGMEFEGEEDWIVYSDKRTRPLRASNAPVIDAESAIEEELEVAAQEPVIKLPPAKSNTDEQALLSRDFNVQDSNSNAPPDQSLEDSLPSLVIRLPPSTATREDDFQETLSSPVISLPPSAAKGENDSQETFSSPVERLLTFAASKEIYLGDDEEFVIVRLPPYVAPSPSKEENADGWDEVLSTKDKSEVKQAEPPSPSQSDTRDTQSQAPLPCSPGARRRSLVQTSEAASKTDAESQYQEEEKLETMSTFSNDEPLEVQESTSPSRSGTRRHSPVQTSEAYSRTDVASQVQEEDMSETLSAFSNDEQLEVQESMSSSQSGILRHSPEVQASEASSKTHVASQIQEEDMSEMLSTLNDDEQLDIREWIREREEVLIEEIRQMEEEFAAKNFPKYYDAALHTSHGNRRASDPGPFSLQFRQTTTSDHKPALLGLSSGFDDKETVKSVESESAKGEETSSPKPGQTLFPPPGLSSPDPKNIPRGIYPPNPQKKPPALPPTKRQNKPPSRPKTNPQNPSQNVYHQPYYQFPQPLLYDPAYGSEPTEYMGYYWEYPQQQMYETPLHLALNQQHLFDPNQPAVQWPYYYWTYPAQEDTAQEDAVQESTAQ